MVLDKLSSGLYNAVRRVIRSAFVDKKVIEELVRDIQRALLQSDVNVELVLKISENIRRRCIEEEPPPGVSRRDYVLKVVYEEIINLLGGPEKRTFRIIKRPYVIMMIGIQGSGKTTSAAKLAYYFKKKGLKVGLVCADTYRPAALEQLAQLAKKIEVPVFGIQDGKDAVSIAKEGIKKFTKEKFDVIIVDTAGRHKDESSLMEEMEEIRNSIKPSEIMMVIDGTIGQQAYTQALAFRESTDIGSIFVTKLDGAARGGGALSAVAATGAPIKMVGVGEHIEDIEEFDPPKFVGRLLGMPDIQSLVQRVREAQVLPSKKKMMKMLKGKITLKDFYEQLDAISSMGSLQKILSMLGLGVRVPKELQGMAEENLRKFKVIMQSMTKEELLNPNIINSSRMRRIARGSGTTVQDVKELLKQYNAMKTFLKRFGKRSKRMRGLPFVAR
ncbi:MAG: signal recognition particle protein Srp54 [Candidatus Asgardarchaeia archaeon]